LTRRHNASPVTLDALHSACERIQRAVLVSMFDACPVDARQVLGLRLDGIGEVVVSAAEYDSSIPVRELNRQAGMRQGGPSVSR
jgi:hypothetical protein